MATESTKGGKLQRGAESRYLATDQAASDQWSTTAASRQRLILRRREDRGSASQPDELLSVIVDHGDQQDPAWKRIPDVSRRVVKLNSAIWSNSLWSRGPLRLIRATIWGFKLWRVSLWSSDDGPIVTYGHEHGFVFALLQLLASPIHQPRRHIMFDLLLLPPREGFAGTFDRAKMSLFNKMVHHAVVWGKRDVVSFARWYRISESKFNFHPYHTTLAGFDITITDGGYIFAGGNAARDYDTVVEALKEVNCPVIIATTRKDVAVMAASYPHITVRGVSEQEFRTLMAGCRVFVEAHDPTFPRTAGHQTMLNAMACGKPVVIADPVSAEWYVNNGVDGLVVPLARPKSMRAAVEKLLAYPELARQLGTEAARKIKEGGYDIPTTMGRVYGGEVMRQFANSPVERWPGGSASEIGGTADGAALQIKSQ